MTAILKHLLCCKCRIPVVVVLLIVGCSFCACTSTILKIAGITNESVNVQNASNGRKKVLFISMKHIAPRTFYDNVGRLADSLQRQGWVFFLEGVGGNSIDSTEMLLARRKMRKLTGLQLTSTGYIDTATNMLAGRIKLDPKLGLVNQPPYPRLQIDMAKAVRADVPLPKLIAAFETEYGVIRLDSCDLNTGLYGPYNCESFPSETRKLFMKDYILGYRNRTLAKMIADSGFDKIAVVYGAGHWEGLMTELQTLDRNWKQRSK